MGKMLDSFNKEECSEFIVGIQTEDAVRDTASVISPLVLSGYKDRFMIGQSLDSNKRDFGMLKSERLEIDNVTHSLCSAARNGVIPTSILARHLLSSFTKIGLEKSPKQQLCLMDTYFNGKHGIVHRAAESFVKWLLKEWSRIPSVSESLKEQVENVWFSVDQDDDTFIDLSGFASFRVQGYGTDQELVLDREQYSISYIPFEYETISPTEVNDLFCWFSSGSVCFFYDHLCLFVDQYFWYDESWISMSTETEKRSALYIFNTLYPLETSFDISNAIENLIACPVVLDSHANYMLSLDEEYSSSLALRIGCSLVLSLMEEGNLRDRKKEYASASTENGEAVCKRLAMSSNKKVSVVGKAIQYLKHREAYNSSKLMEWEDGQSIDSNIHVMTFDASLIDELTCYSTNPDSCQSNLHSFIDCVMGQWSQENDEFCGNGGYGEAGVGQMFDPNFFYTEKDVKQSILSDMKMDLFFNLLYMLKLSEE